MAQTQPAGVGASGGEDDIPHDVCVYGELEEFVVTVSQPMVSQEQRT